jgi:hypothetical protein
MESFVRQLKSINISAPKIKDLKAIGALLVYDDTKLPFPEEALKHIMHLCVDLFRCHVKDPYHDAEPIRESARIVAAVSTIDPCRAKLVFPTCFNVMKRSADLDTLTAMCQYFWNFMKR